MSRVERFSMGLIYTSLVLSVLIGVALVVAICWTVVTLVGLVAS